MRKYKFSAILCSILLLCGSCRLAREDGGLNRFQDKLIGLFITTEYLDLFDFESYVNDALRGYKGGELFGNTQEYQGRLYATLITKSSIQEETGEASYSAEYVFEGLEGIALYAPMVPAAEEHGSFISSVSGEGIQSHMGLHEGDEEDRLTLEGTIHVTPSEMNHTYYFNPVYQSADSRVYLISGGGFMINEQIDEGPLYSQTLEDTRTVTENKKTKIDYTSVTISLRIRLAPEKFVVLQMDADSGLLSRDTYDPGEVPETFAVHPDMAYLIVETYKRDYMGKLTIEREVYDAEADSFGTYAVRADGVCVGRLTWIILPSESIALA